MKFRKKSIDNRVSRWGIIGAIGAAIAASLCCVVPLVLVLFGVGGAWVGSFVALEPYRPWFIGLTVLLLAAAFYRVYRRPKEECEPGSVCDEPSAGRRNKVFLWLATVFVAVLISFPYFAPQFFAEEVSTINSERTESVVLDISNMTCAACAVTISKSLTALDGVQSADVTFKPPRAKVVYNPDKVSPADLTSATKKIGYPSRVRKSK